MSDETLLRQIEDVLDEIRPNIQMDGGDVKFIRFDDGVVYVKLEGACVGCPAATQTLKFGIEESLKDQVSEVREVIAVDHE
ncbi:NifU family protein [Candidatus Dependentiae bacterium]|nr:NifU family protein [Candidatus Dependentiae bacterium]